MLKPRVYMCEPVNTTRRLFLVSIVFLQAVMCDYWRRHVHNNPQLEGSLPADLKMKLVELETL